MLTSPAARLGSLTRQDLQALLDDASLKAGVVGAQLSVCLGDETLDLVHGLANAEQRVPMSTDTIVPIGSITKLFNAALILSLVDDGTLALDTPLATFIPGLRLADDAQHAISLRQLLSMSAGLDNGPYAVRGNGDDSLAAYAHSLQDVPHPYRPGAGFGYSNAGSCLAGYAAQCAAGRQWHDLLRSRLLLPCGLPEWALGADELPFHRVSVGHVAAQTPGAVHSVLRPWGYSAAQAPAGSTLSMSARSLARFGALLASGGQTTGASGLSTTAVVQMTTPTSRVPCPIPLIGIGDAWGLGPSRSRWGEHDVWSHAGGMRSARSMLSWIPSIQGVLAMTVNTPAAFTVFASHIVRSVRQAVFCVPPPQRIRLHSGTAQAPNPSRFVGTYVRFGTRYDIGLRDDEGLRYRETNLGVALPHEVIGTAVDCDCVADGGDAFLISVPGFDEPLPIAFSGSDANGRATGLMSTLFPGRRVET